MEVSRTTTPFPRATRSGTSCDRVAQPEKVSETALTPLAISKRRNPLPPAKTHLGFVLAEHADGDQQQDGTDD